MTRAPKRKRFVVEGGGEFPYDMLRYDSCWPEQENPDSFQLTYQARGRRQVTLLTDSPHAPTIGRWQSFLWRVISSETVQ